MKSRKQRTIKYPVSCTGVGLHTGVQSTITFNPAPENFGIKFSRTDKKDVLVTPDIDNVVDLTRGTTIQEKGVKVHTTEHVLSACAGMGVDNLLIELNSKEPPVMDGSSKEFIELIKKSGVKLQSKKRKYLKILDTVRVSDDDKELIIESSEDFAIDFDIEFKHKSIGHQNYSLLVQRV